MGRLSWPGHWTLATRVVIASAALLAALLAIVVATEDRANDERRRAEVDHSYETAQAVAGIVDGFASDLETTMLAAALLLGDRPEALTQATAGDHLKRLTEQYGLLRAIFVADLDGRVIASDSGAGHGTDLSARPYMQSLRAGAKEVWGPGVAGIDSGEVTATYGRVITDGAGTVRGYLVAAFYPPRLAERIEPRISADADVVLIDGLGFVLYSTAHPNLTPEARDLSGLPAVQAALYGAPTRLDGVTGLLGSDERFGAIVPIRNPGWAVAFSRPVAPLESMLRQRLLVQAGQVTASVLVVGILMTVSTRRIARPLARLARVAENVARGERESPPVIEGGPEVRTLSAAMQAMSASVAQREDAIRLESERRRKLAEASRAFTEAVVDLDAETETIAQSVAEALADGCAVMLLSEDGARLHVAAVYHPDTRRQQLARAALQARPLVVDGSRLEPLVRSAETLFLADATPLLQSAYPERAGLVEQLGLNSLACVPLRAHGRVIGLLGVWRDAGEALLPDDVVLLQEIGDRAALAIENARLFMAVGAHAVEVERAMLAQDDLLSLISHDLRNPMTTIKAAAQLVYRRVDAGNARREDILPVISMIDAAVAKVTREIDAILDLSLARAGRMLGLQVGQVDLVPLVEHVATMHGEGVPNEIVVESEEPHLHGQWDSSRLERVFDNLIGNAVKYSPGGDPVTVRVTREMVGDAPWATVMVQDRGIGIPASEIDRVFDRFYRGSQVVGRMPGTGLGLSGVKLIVEAHGGQVHVESAEGVGSTFTVRLPCLPPE